MKRIAYGTKRDRRGFMYRISVDARADRRERNGIKRVREAQGDRVLVALRKQARSIPLCFGINWANTMDDIASAKVEAGCDYCTAWAEHPARQFLPQSLASVEQLGTSSAMDCPIDTTPTYESRVSGIYDCHRVLLNDVALAEFNGGRCRRQYVPPLMRFLLMHDLYVQHAV